MSISKIIVFGSNQYGQAGVANGEDAIPTLNHHLASYIDPTTIARVVSTQKQSYMLLTDGSILSCGENDRNELGRSGKRSLFQRIDSVEAFSITDIAVGDGFSLLAARDGKVICWGINDMGQLSSGDRDTRERPKVNSTITEGILQLAAGSQHALALTKTGNVISWGGNRKGQLGDGQMTSSIVPLTVTPLRHRPVISIACGESHSLALTIGGNVYAWGDNSQGQLGLGDNTTRLRVELIRSLRTAKVTKISAGRQHTMVVSRTGLLFAFGSNSFGQLGICDLDIRVQATPVVVERLRELRTVDVCCGSAHTLVLCKTQAMNISKVYVMGLNSSGQLGLGHTHNIATPHAIMTLPTDYQPIGLASGPLSMTSYIFLEGVPLIRPSLPSLELVSLEQNIEKLTSAVKGSGRAVNELRIFRENIASAFSSISVLNASFRIESLIQNQPTQYNNDPNSLCVNLEHVRKAYSMLQSLGNDQVMWTLGRATLQLSEHLKECPWDDIENLSVFLIVLENPLMLQPQSYHIMIERVISGILALPKQCRTTLFGWLRSYSSEYFSQILLVLKGYLAYGFANKAHNIDPAPAVLVLNSLYQCNQETRIVPDSSFYHPNLYKAVNLFEEWKKYKESDKNSKVFNFYSYPFILDYEVKNAVMRVEFQELQSHQARLYLQKYFYRNTFPSAHSSSTAAIPKGVKFYANSSCRYGLTPSEPNSIKPECCFEIIVNRNFVVK